MSWQKKATLAVVLLILFVSFTGVFWYQEIRSFVTTKAAKSAGKIPSREKKHAGKVEIVKAQAPNARNLSEKSPLRGKKPRTHQTTGSLTVAEYYAAKGNSGGNPQLAKKNADPFTDWTDTSANLMTEARSMTTAYYTLTEKYQRDKLYSLSWLRKILP